jgi:hypothetical protein
VRDWTVRGKQIHEPDADLSCFTIWFEKEISLQLESYGRALSLSFSGMVSFITQINFRNDSNVHLNHNVAKVKKLTNLYCQRIFNAEWNPELQHLWWCIPTGIFSEHFVLRLCLLSWVYYWYLHINWIHSLKCTLLLCQSRGYKSTIKACLILLTHVLTWTRNYFMQRANWKTVVVLDKV